MFGQYSPILPQLLNDSHVESRIFSSSSNTATKVDLSRRIPAHIFFNCFSRQFPGFPDCQNDFQQASHGRSRAPQKSWKRVCFHRSCLVNVRSRSKRYEFGLPRRSTNLVGLGKKGDGCTADSWHIQKAGGLKTVHKFSRSCGDR